ncbi:MAG: efflux RND transporter periplasmic adaptor subunit [Burkholderiales bacterium]
MDILWQQFTSAANQDSRIGAWLGLQCATVTETSQGVVVLGAADVGPFVPKASWPPDKAISKAPAEAAEQSLVSRQPLAVRLPRDGDCESTSCAIAYPLEINGQLQGVVALRIAERPEKDLNTCLRQIQWGLGWLETLTRDSEQRVEQEAQQRLMTVLDLVATVLEQKTFEAAARALVTEIAMRENCDRVSMGQVRKARAHVLALSHSAQFGKKMNLLNFIGMAMDEAIDQKTVVAYPPIADTEVVVTRDHEKLAREHGSDCVLTIPFAGGTDFVGALTLERPADLPFDAATVELLQSVMAVLGRILHTMHTNDLPVHRRAGRALGEALSRLFGARYMKTKVMLIAVVSLVLFLSFATGLWRVSATANLEGAVRRTLVAPFDGYVVAAPRRAGDIVRAQTVLASLDERDLRLERARWASQYAQYAKQYEEAVAVRDRAKAQVAQAQAEQARAQAALIDEQIARANVRAPFDGLVVKGDLSQALGSAVKRGETLFEIAPLNAYRVIVQVDESEIAELKVGQRGTLILASIADEHFEFTVSKITPVTTAREGRNYFRVEGILDQTSERLRPGMEGVGKIEVDERRWIWIWTYRLVNWLRLFVWSWWP